MSAQSDATSVLFSCSLCPPVVDRPLRADRHEPPVTGSTHGELSSPTRETSTGRRAADDGLTPAQRRVLIVLAGPFAAPHAVPTSNRQIAEELVVSIDAVKANLRALFERFDVEE